MPCAAMLGADETGRALSTRRGGLHYVTKRAGGARQHKRAGTCKQ